MTMRAPDQQLSSSFKLVLGFLISVSVGQVALADSAEPISTPAAVVQLLSGPQVYNNVCIACHSPPGVGGAPALGNGDAWAARIDQGMETLIDHALNGYSGDTGVMPKKGGPHVKLSDEEIIGAIKYMVEQASQ